MEFRTLRQKPFNHIPADPKDAVVPTVSAVNQVTLTRFDHLRAESDQPDIKQDDRERQPRQPQEMTNVSTFQIKAIAFNVAESLINPHAPTISLANCLWRGQVGGQEPGFFFTRLPIGQEVDRVSILGGKHAGLQPLTLSRLLHQAIQALEVSTTVFPQQITAYLPQNIHPMPFLEQFLLFNITEFNIPDQENA